MSRENRIEANGKHDFALANGDLDDSGGYTSFYHGIAQRTQALVRRRTHGKIRLYVLCFIFLVIPASLWLSTRLGILTSPSAQVNDVFNATLGFEKVFVLSLPSRSDRRDAITLAARLTDIDFEWVDGVCPDDIADQAIPPGWDFKRENKAVLATWRAHTNILQKIVHENIATALILEDDSDWDITIKAQLAQFATGVRLISQPGATHENKAACPSSPYGSDWHMLWPGNCRMSPSDKTAGFYIQPDDLTVPPPGRRWAVWSNPHRPPEAQQPHSRMTFRADGTGMCLYAYAVSQLGAQKMLAQIAMRPQRKPIDVLVRNMCRGENADVIGAFDCYGVYPTLVGSHRAKGPGTRDSDNRETKADKHDEYSRDVVYSTTMNAAHILAQGPQAEVAAQWPEDVTRLTINLADDFSSLVGQGRLHEIDLRLLQETEMPSLIE